MITVYSPDHALHDPPHEFLDGALVPVFESPVRAAIILEALERAGIGPVVPPRAFGVAPVRAVHSPDYLAYLERAYERWVAAGGAPEAVLPSTLAVRWMSRRCESPLAAPGYYCFDLSAPIVPGTFRAALASAAVALTGAALLLDGERAAYALCRPPGHHAGADMCGGYCFLNNAAIAAQYLLTLNAERRTLHDGVSDAVDGLSSAGGAGKNLQPSAFSLQPSRVAVLDIDFHHGNGTQQIFYERDDVLVVSLHADPAHQYPMFLGYADERGAGTGRGFNLNLPLPLGTTDGPYLEALDEALAAVRAFAPAALVVSAGFDTFIGDPVAAHGGGFALSAAAYPEVGRRIGALGLPTLFVQEGGYGIAALGENVVGLLRGFEEQA
ncbi:MAG TPA: histone deacetylase family protein [Roseiflexaceae bacterium]|nr:histone deacetylase family protein [Roseiflexaceae bacterium]